MLIAAFVSIPAHASLAAPRTAAPHAGDRPASVITIKVEVPRRELDRLRATNMARARRGQPAVSPAHATVRRVRIAGRHSAAALSLARGARLSHRPAVAAPAERDSGAASPLIGSPGENPDPRTVGDCFRGDQAGTPIGHVLNRFVYCQAVGIKVEYYSIDDGVPEKEGDTTATMDVFAQGDNQDRRIRVYSRLAPGSVDYSWGPIDDIFVAPNVPLTIMPSCEQDLDVCSATPSGATLPWTVWDHSSDWYHWDVYNFEDTAEGRDKISYNRWFVEFFTDNGEYHTLQRGRTAARLMRCDSATYFKLGAASYPKACIFPEVIPHLIYRVASNYRSVALHIFNAQQHPNNTYPLLVPEGVPRPRDKRIPGTYVPGDPNAPGLHRITQQLQPGEYKANEENVKGACWPYDAKKGGPLRHLYFDLGLPAPGPQAPAEDCDEYPFKSTLEGAANPFWDFSVQAVPFQDNRIAGNVLKQYYVNDRILAWDPTLDRPDDTNDRFYVEIK